VGGCHQDRQKREKPAFQSSGPRDLHHLWARSPGDVTVFMFHAALKETISNLTVLNFFSRKFRKSLRFRVFMEYTYPFSG
jgi:hypothetical protein